MDHCEAALVDLTQQDAGPATRLPYRHETLASLPKKNPRLLMKTPRKLTTEYLFPEARLAVGEVAFLPSIAGRGQNSHTL